MPSREAPSYSSSRVQRASRLNSIEQARLQHQLHLLEKAYVHQARLTNQDIRLTSLALEYIQACSGHSPEGRGPISPQGGEDTTQQEDPCFLYGERVMSRKVRRMARPHSAVDRALDRRNQSSDTSSSASVDDSAGVRVSLPPRPQSSPAKGRVWAWSSGEETTDGSIGSEVDLDRPQSRASTSVASRPPTPGRGRALFSLTPTPGRVTPHQAWEDDTDDVTRKLLKAQKQQQQQEAQGQFLHVRDSRRMRFRTSMTISRNRLSHSPSSLTSAVSSGRQGSFPLPPDTPSGPAMEDRNPVSPQERRARSGSAVLGRKAGVADIMNQARGTLSAAAWRRHLANTQTAPRSSESQKQILLEARRGREKEKQDLMQQKVESFIGQINSW